MEKKNVFTFKGVYKWEVKAIERQLKEKLQELKTETGKQKAIERYTEKKNNVIKKYEALRGKTFKNIKIEISVSWVKSYMWGYNPHADVVIYTKDSNDQTTWERINTTASGCGYDKLSQVVAQALNESLNIKAFLLSKVRKLNAMKNSRVGLYGLYDSFDLMGGCGVSSYKSIFEGLGFTWYHNSTNTSDFILIEYKK